jgi:hypothetical protein
MRVQTERRRDGGNMNGNSQHKLETNLTETLRRALFVISGIYGTILLNVFEHSNDKDITEPNFKCV